MNDVLCWIVYKNGNVYAGFTTQDLALDFIKEQDFSDNTTQYGLGCVITH